MSPFSNERRFIDFFDRDRCGGEEELLAGLAEFTHVNWKSRAEKIGEPLLCVARGQAFCESLGREDVESSVLLMAEVNFIDSKDPRLVRQRRR